MNENNSASRSPEADRDRALELPRLRKVLEIGQPKLEDPLYDPRDDKLGTTKSGDTIFLYPVLEARSKYRRFLSPTEQKVFDQLKARVDSLKKRPGQLELQITSTSAERVSGRTQEIHATQFGNFTVVYSSHDSRVLIFNEGARQVYATELNKAAENTLLKREAMARALGVQNSGEQRVGLQVAAYNFSKLDATQRSILSTQNELIGLPFSFEQISPAMRQKLVQIFLHRLGNQRTADVVEERSTDLVRKWYQLILGSIELIPEEVTLFNQHALSRPQVLNGHLILHETGVEAPTMVILNHSQSQPPKSSASPIFKFGENFTDETGFNRNLLTTQFELLESGGVDYIHQYNTDLFIVVRSAVVEFINPRLRASGARTGKVLSHQLDKVGSNINRSGSEVIYCPETTNAVYQVDADRLSNDPDVNEALIVKTTLPSTYRKVRNPHLDDSHNFLMLEASGIKGQIATHVFYRDYANPTVWHLLNIFPDLHNARFIGDKIYAVNTDGNYVVGETNLNKLKQNYELAKAVGEISVPSPQELAAKVPESVKAKIEDIARDIQAKIGDIKKLNIPSEHKLQKLIEFQGGIQQVIDRLVQTDEAVASYIESSNPIQSLLRDEVEEMAWGITSTLISEAVSLSQSLSMSNVMQLNKITGQVRELRPHIVTSERGDKVSTAIREVELKIRTFYEQSTAIIKAQVDDVIELARQDLRLVEDQSQFGVWLGGKGGNYRARLIGTDQSCPAHAAEAKKIISQAQIEFEELIDTKLDELKKQKEATSQRERQAKDNQRLSIIAQIKTLVKVTREKMPSGGAEASRAIKSDPLFAQISEQIAAINDRDQQAQLREFFEVQIEAYISQAESTGQVSASEDGRQYVKFSGTIFYPEWQPPEIESGGVTGIDLTWIPISDARDTDGHLGYVIKTNKGKLPAQRLYQQFGIEEEVLIQHGFSSRLGIESGEIILSPKDARKVISDYQLHWQGEKPVEYEENGEKKSIVLKQELQRLRDNVRAIYDTKPKLPAGVTRSDTDPKFQAFQDSILEWKEKSRAQITQALIELGNFYRRFPYVTHFSRADQVEANARGAKQLNPWEDHQVEFSPHWRIDAQASQSLEKMTSLFIQQERLNQGMVVLDGPAGTGKDILIKMWCAKTRTPLYSFDCTKWTTEKELTQKVTVTMADGQPVTAYIPSTILQGIQVPGALVYFNEYNAMPIESQLVLNALLDEKRQISLKLEGGKIVKVARGVKFAASQNSGYAGTNASINPATVSRTTPIPVNYPDLNAEVRQEQGMTRKIYLPNEAMRMSGYSQILRKLSRGAELDKVPFNIYWNIYINDLPQFKRRLKSQGGDLEDLPEAAQFELKVLCALMVYSQEIRRLHLTRTNDTNIPSPKIPIDGRSLAYCVDYLSYMVPDSEKLLIGGQHEKLAFRLIAEFYASKIPEIEVREKLLKHLQNSVVVRIPPQ